MEEHREVENTYAPGPGTDLPDLAALPGVARVGDAVVEQLDATYFDTVDLTLLSAGVTLRRREGGSDEGWHLKLPVGQGRDEIRLPLSAARKAPPRRLLDIVRGRTRGAPVVAVATVVTRRTERPLQDESGTVLAELADDEVVGTDLERGSEVSWREWEVELVEGDVTLLDAVDQLMQAADVPASGRPRKILHVLGDRLEELEPVPAPRPGSPAGDVLRLRLAEQVEALLVHDTEVRRGRAEGVHQARIACRRLRVALATFRPLVDRGVTDPLRDELRWFGRQLAEPRDVTVVRQRLQELLDQEPRALVRGPARRRLRTTYDVRGRAARDRVEELLVSDRYLALLDNLEALVREPPLTASARRPASKELRARVLRDWERLDRQVEDILGGHDDDVAWHQARKDAKRFRYAAETLRPVWPKDARRLVKSAKTLTTHLGERQDTVVSRVHLVEIGREADATGESSFVWGRLHAREQARCAELDGEFEAIWRRAARPRRRSWLT
ncbi:CYTH and CHAD domain-containing protein [Nocardioides sp. MAHUQ-72]|uniref:CYTH and CHAD domain-containing protein n=1 Tax=unclassified Nocardioides TaxID=2615069 RepID=UPI00360CCF3B